jgi:hypothetical protein
VLRHSEHCVIVVFLSDLKFVSIRGYTKDCFGEPPLRLRSAQAPSGRRGDRSPIRTPVASVVVSSSL